MVIEEADDGLTTIEKYKAIISDNNSFVDLIVLGEIFLLDLFLHILLLICVIIRCLFILSCCLCFFNRLYDEK